MERWGMRSIRYILCCLLVLAVWLTSLMAQADQDITRECRMELPGDRKAWKAAFDGGYRTAWTQRRKGTTRLVVHLPPSITHGGLYLCFAIEPDEMTVTSGELTIYHQLGAGFAHRYVPFVGADKLTIELVNNRSSFAISEMRIYAGDAPQEAQQWLPPLQYADLLIVVAHPDDELLWMGGAIPYYALERGKRVAVAYMTCANPLRRSELLNGLWTAGIRHYPIIGAFPDQGASNVREMFVRWGGQDHVEACLTELLRRLRPQVVLTHDLHGEYGHKAHIATARAVLCALDAAADGNQFPDSARQYGTWDVPKAYLHLYPGNPIEMDWQLPIAARAGKTAIAVAADAFARHRSANRVYQVRTSGRYSSTRFGLCRTLVGPDVARNDFFENLPDIQ